VINGVVMCFYGYRAFKVVLGLFGVLAGGYAAATLGLYWSEGRVLVGVLCAVMGAALGGVLMVTLYLLSVFVIGAVLGGMLAAVFTLHAPPDTRALVILAAALIGGVVALFVQRLLIIVATAINGAALIVVGLWFLYVGLSPRDGYELYTAAAAGPGQSILHKYLLVGIAAALGCLGAWVQFSHRPAPDGQLEED